MSLDATVTTLRDELGRLRDAVEALHTTIAQDAPTADAAEPVGRLDMLVIEMSALLDEAIGVAADHGWHDAVDGTLDPERRGLRAIHDLLNAFTERYTTRLAAPDEVLRLFQMAHERRQGWWQWCQAVKAGIDACAWPLVGTASALSACWSELADRLARHSVSVSATNIGQQISGLDVAPGYAAREA